MELQTVCSGLPSQPLEFSNRRIISSQAVGIGTHTPFRFQRPIFRFGNESKCLKWVIKEPSLLGLNKFQRLLIHASDSNVNGSLEVHSNQNSSVPVTGYDGVEPFRGKPGSVSFYGLTYHSIEEGKLESSPFGEEGSSYFWLLAPTVFVASLILPQFFIGNVVGTFFKDVILEAKLQQQNKTTIYDGCNCVYVLMVDNVKVSCCCQYQINYWPDIVTE